MRVQPGGLALSVSGPPPTPKGGGNIYATFPTLREEVASAEVSLPSQRWHALQPAHHLTQFLHVEKTKPINIIIAKKKGLLLHQKPWGIPEKWQVTGHRWRSKTHRRPARSGERESKLPCGQVADLGCDHKGTSKVQPCGDSAKEEDGWPLYFFSCPRVRGLCRGDHL